MPKVTSPTPISAWSTADDDYEHAAEDDEQERIARVDGRETDDYRSPHGRLQTKLTSAVDSQEELPKIAQLFNENIRLRESEIALAAELKRQREKSRKVLYGAEMAALNLTKHLGFVRETFNIRHTSDTPSPTPPRATHRPLTSTPPSPRLSREPTVPGIRDLNESDPGLTRDPSGEYSRLEERTRNPYFTRPALTRESNESSQREFRTEGGVIVERDGGGGGGEEEPNRDMVRLASSSRHRCRSSRPQESSSAAVAKTAATGPAQSRDPDAHPGGCLTVVSAAGVTIVTPQAVAVVVAGPRGLASSQVVVCCCREDSSRPGPKPEPKDTPQAV
ncbi:hypothetical protein BDZ89DRAFT_1045192 [Hymenopellis radicata]|nr:hypothetical protein BDZ89DRAFT_1045192 [Hymenopellis radicata]